MPWEAVVGSSSVDHEWWDGEQLQVHPLCGSLLAVVAGAPRFSGRWKQEDDSQARRDGQQKCC